MNEKTIAMGVNPDLEVQLNRTTLQFKVDPLQQNSMNINLYFSASPAAAQIEDAMVEN